MLYESPSLMPQLVNVLMKFRCRKIGMTGDIEKAFLNVEIAEADRNFLRVLWLKDFDPYQEIVSRDSFKIRTLCLWREIFSLSLAGNSPVPH